MWAASNWYTQFISTQHSGTGCIYQTCENICGIFNMDCSTCVGRTNEQQTGMHARHEQCNEHCYILVESPNWMYSTSIFRLITIETLNKQKKWRSSENCIVYWFGLFGNKNMGNSQYSIVFRLRSHRRLPKYKFLSATNAAHQANVVLCARGN